MYLEYWNLNLLPFDNAPDPRFFYESQGHKEAIMRLMFAVQTRKAIALLTGDYGIGKTQICETVINRLSSNEFKVAFVVNPRMEAIDLIREIAFQLGDEVSTRETYDALHALNKLLDRHAATGRHCVTFLDEAQLLLNPTILEDMRLLLNHHAGGRYLMTLILVGQTEFGNMLKTTPQMIQRIGFKYHIPHLQAVEVSPYIVHRLTVAGRTAPLFSPDAVEAITKFSKGNPREINALCDMCLLIGSLTNKTQIDANEVLEAKRERE